MYDLHTQKDCLDSLDNILQDNVLRRQYVKFSAHWLTCWIISETTNCWTTDDRSLHFCGTGCFFKPLATDEDNVLRIDDQSQPVKNYGRYRFISELKRVLIKVSDRESFESHPTESEVRKVALTRSIRTVNSVESMRDPGPEGVTICLAQVYAS